MARNRQFFSSFEEFVLSAESRGMTCPEFAQEIGIEECGVYVVLTGDGKFRFFDRKSEIPCPFGFEVSWRIGEYVQENHVEAVTIPEGVSSVGDGAFFECTSLTSVSIPNSVTRIGMEAFAGCTSLRSVSISNFVRRIGDWTFSGCTSLRSVTIPESVTKIGGWAFFGCTSLRNIVLPKRFADVMSRFLDRQTKISFHK